MPTMKVVHCHDYGGSEVLVVEETARPEPSADEMLVRVRAASVSPIDWKMREGYLRGWFELPMPMVLGRDFAGDVEEVGANVTGFRVGDAVFGSVQVGKGCHTQYVIALPSEVAHKPASLDYEIAAAVPHSGLAAWQGLVDSAGLKEGQTVLVHAAAGGVGSFAVQIARALGARVIGTCSAGNMDFVRNLGADDVIDYQASRFEDLVHDVDIVLDTIGDDTQERSWQVLKSGGVLATLIGFTPSSQEIASARGIRAEMVGMHPDAEDLQQLADLIEAGKVKPIVSTVLPMEEARRAYDMSQSGHTRGKIILQTT